VTVVLVGDASRGAAPQLQVTGAFLAEDSSVSQPDADAEMQHGHREIEGEPAATVSNTVADAPFVYERERSQNGSQDRCSLEIIGRFCSENVAFSGSERDVRGAIDNVRGRLFPNCRLRERNSEKNWSR
jgi:hypothetical protein